jgi:hypothetical protein
MKRLRFGIRSILILATMVAIFMFFMLERRRYFREHVFITVLDSSSGIQLNQFQYRTWIITQDSPPWPKWSDWKSFQRGGIRSSGNAASFNGILSSRALNPFIWNFGNQNRRLARCSKTNVAVR